MSHSTTIRLIADQEVEFMGVKVNIHDIGAVEIDYKGIVVNVFLEPENDEIHKGWLFEDR